MDEYEDSLLSALGSRYLDLLVDEMESRRTSFSAESMRRRSEKVFSNLWDAGEESRATCWQRLRSYVSLPMQEAVDIASGFVAKRLESADTGNLTEFLVQYAKRLDLDMTDSDKWGLENWEELGQRLLTLADNRKDAITSDAHEKFVHLAVEWSEVDVTGKFAVRLVELIREAHRPWLSEVADAWIKSLDTTIAQDCLDWLAAHFLSLMSESERENIVAKLDVIASHADFTEDQGKRYVQFLDHLPIEAASDEIMGEHLERILVLTSEQYSNPSYVRYAFAPMPRFLSRLAPNVVGVQTSQFDFEYPITSKFVYVASCTDERSLACGKRRSLALLS